ncbi:DUF2934 domain-containing protein [Pseudomonas sp. P66]|jgi:hypothetical protein|uniref:DUF2934 domain-containing protein n=1 Tax=Pseudomonas arcuscaelestis TaxID=2710591 RepID=A0ABS2C1E4_9PSED|nr:MULTISPECIES: DUF2934 domain-containing protein [Pseudomonas]MBM3103581.1 DUF2934 domain-containing protein [Pseudomonas arcuscaelestis]MBM3110458.1 DUF2934 domain-containing protein [Pseudomonas arcuscaelestis]MBM5459704.1 DUF2934 domain-containing protein [Pseudomonas arcuscaelestis]
MSIDDKRISEFAYQIWESEGKPEGQESRHWEMARKLAEAESLAPKATPRKAKAKPAPASTAEVAAPSKKPAPAAKKPRPPKKPTVA